MYQFLFRMSNYDLKIMNILRVFMKLIILRDNSYQLALYIYGPGGCG